MSEENKTPLLEVKDLKKWFPAKSSPFSKEKVFIKAVDGVSFTLNAGETLGVVGEQIMRSICCVQMPVWSWKTINLHGHGQGIVHRITAPVLFSGF